MNQKEEEGIIKSEKRDILTFYYAITDFFIIPYSFTYLLLFILAYGQFFLFLI